jgi:hypothetical protein
MKAEFTAIIEPAPEGGFGAICPGVPGANAQGETIEEAKDNLRRSLVASLCFCFLPPYPTVSSMHLRMVVSV